MDQRKRDQAINEYLEWGVCEFFGEEIDLSDFLEQFANPDEKLIRHLRDCRHCRKLYLAHGFELPEGVEPSSEDITMFD
ncbi:MAG TPA: hypothetical protein VGA49_01290 [Patescibacteria group bacterium]